MSKHTCHHEDCTGPVHARKLCAKHYRRHLLTTAEQCSIDACGRPVLARAMCSKHYARWSKHGDPRICLEQVRKPPEGCSVEGCERPASARNWCKQHYERWRIHGDPLATMRKQRPWAAIDPDNVQTRECASCSRSLPIYEFPPHRTKPERLRGCRTCTAASRLERFGGSARDQHHYKVMVKFGITDAAYQQMVQAQVGRCAICGSPPGAGRKKYLSVDHCHATGKIRALLCDPCNMGLGQFGDDPERLIAAAEYIIKHRA